MFTQLGFIGNLSPLEIGAIILVALLLFGRRLPEVGRSLGRGIVEFKKGIKGIEEEVETASTRQSVHSQVSAKSSSGASSSLPPAESGGVNIQPPADRSGQEARVSRADGVD
ncbi:MAG: twin-arginine translocase TatA/TatE family subunit [Phycisphaeraceae bacterium]|nr:twin-arginine translocase TatA/TatE family subunit [Phycisphaeraceae bacterium]